MNDHGLPVDPTARCEAPIRGGFRQCGLPALMPGRQRDRAGREVLIDVPFCWVHFCDARRPDEPPVAGYEWHALYDGQGRPYLWFQLRVDAGARRRAVVLDRNRRAFSGSSRAREEIRRAFGGALRMRG